MLFAGSVGRTDLGGNFPQLRSGIRAKLFTLPDATLVYPGPRAGDDDRGGEADQSFRRRGVPGLSCALT